MDLDLGFVKKSDLDLDLGFVNNTQRTRPDIARYGTKKLKMTQITTKSKSVGQKIKQNESYSVSPTTRRRTDVLNKQ